jgi:hypothetical protein
VEHVVVLAPEVPSEVLVVVVLLTGPVCCA